MKNIGNIKTFLKHKNPDKLTELMMINNVKTKCYHDYVIIFADGIWYAWYEIDINDFVTRKFADVRINKG